MTDNDERDGEGLLEPETIDLQPPEERPNQNVIQNLEKPLEDDSFLLGVETNYDETKEHILDASRAEGTQYVWKDSKFPAHATSMYFSDVPSSVEEKIEWKRPHEISKNPRLVKDDVASDDINQGQLGDCWWLSSVAAVSRIPKYMRRLIPSDNKLEGDEYVGMFHFRFWRFGNWVDVIVDDLLPTSNEVLFYGSSSDPDEFWLPFMEKAYAKLHGSYEVIAGGFTQDALEDLTGGMAVVFDLGKDVPKGLYRRIAKALRNESFAACSITGSGEAVNRRTGLVSAHAYTITGAKRIKFRGSDVELIRVRNPWGNEVEWKGDWSDSSPLWDQLDASVRESLGYADKDNGEWWMDFKDFTRHFDNATICTMGPDFDSDGKPTGDQWYLSKAKGSWLKGVSAGGSRNDVYSFATNPQYYLELREPDDFDPERDEPEEEGKCSIVVGLMQEYRRVGRSEGLENLYIGFSVYKLSERPTSRLPVDHFRYNSKHASSGTYTNRREVSLTADFDPGHYVIVPTTYEAGKVGTFLIRVFTEKEISLEELH